jgi:hypothetical protein
MLRPKRLYQAECTFPFLLVEQASIYAITFYLDSIPLIARFRSFTTVPRNLRAK